MQKINFQNLPSTTTPLNATNLNALQTNVEDVFNGTVPAGDMVVDSIRSKNMFNVNTCIGGLNNNGTISESEKVSIISLDNETGTIIFTSSEEWRGIVSNYIEIEASSQYILSLTSSSNQISLLAYYYDASKQYLSATGISNSTAFTTPSSVKYVRFSLVPNTTISGQITLSNIQFEKGSSATSYSPYQELDKPTIQTGSGVIDTTYIDSVENNHWEKYGNVVSYSFTMRIKGTWSYTTQFITGLPKPKAYTRFLGTSNGKVYRFSIDNGIIANAYSYETPSAGQTIEGHFVYISED